MNDVSLKMRIRNISREKKISAQSVLQNYLMSRFLYRLSMTEYKDKFVVKGGMLIASMVGIEHRATMDLDTTLRNFPLTEEAICLQHHTINRFFMKLSEQRQHIGKALKKYVIMEGL